MQPEWQSAVGKKKGPKCGAASATGAGLESSVESSQKQDRTATE